MDMDVTTSGYSNRTDGMLFPTEEKEYRVSFQEQMKRRKEAETKCKFLIQEFRPTADLTCPPVWDHVTCWNATEAGVTVKQPCPNYIHKFLLHGFARKTCTDNGTWYIHPVYNRSWTDFTGCIPLEKRWQSINPHLDRIQIMSIVGYAVSLVSLIVAVVVLLQLRYRAILNCKRTRSKITTLHINMFLSYILRAAASLLKDYFLVDGFALPKDILHNGELLGLKDDGPHWECKLLVSFFVYTLVASTFWLTMDAHVLRKLIDKDPWYLEKKRYTRLHIAIGWVGPLVIVIAWALFRTFAEDYLCWNTNPRLWTVWIYRVPIIFMNLANFLYFSRIVTFMYKRVRRNCLKRKTNNNRGTILKMTKHICILIPLFGVPYIIFTIMSFFFDVAYLYAEMFFSSFQGFLLSVTLCFTDKRVVQEVRQIVSRCVRTQPKRNIGRKVSQFSTTGKTLGSDVY
ncbi:parathyroid hormone/parathyroid hormone-related peptide receptor-like [Saccostrea echinata]|uniref:parathyroid hormone/parathyroid hormone-related peptide receptor-like n=1 Tax=Saccostrea echinata TaxID=191078 RepID=UPI002A8237E1|nr:parathyroid hormone/parathyroid hormone-related peptide receptor-like [Saccostrea echinata]